MESKLFQLLNDTIIPVLTGGGVAWAVSGYLSKKLIEQKLKKELELYKSELSHRADALKTNLSIYAQEQTIALTRVDEQRAAVIHDIFKSLREPLNLALKIQVGCPLVNSCSDDELEFYSSKAETCQKACIKLSQSLINHAIYFDADTFNLLIELSNNINNIIAKFLKPIRQGAAEGNNINEIISNVKNEKDKLKASLQADVLPLSQKVVITFSNS